MPVPPAPGAFSMDPLLLAAVGAIGAGQAWALLTAGIHGRAAWWRAASLGGGVAILAVALLSPLATVAQHYLFSAHILQNILVMGAAPPLLLLGLPPRAGTSGRSGQLRGVLRGAGRVAVHPVVAILCFNVVFFAWHATPAHQAALGSEPLHVLEELSLLAVALQFWWPITAPWSSHRGSMSPPARVGYILLATIPQTLAGLIYALAPRPFYATYANAPRLLSWSPTVDQQVGGAFLAMLSKVALFVAFSVIFIRLLGPGPEADDEDDGRDPGDDAPDPIPGLPAWVGRGPSGWVTREEPQAAPSRGPRISPRPGRPQPAWEQPTPEPVGAPRAHTGARRAGVRT